MTNLSQSFNKMLEQYVFATASLVIDRATPEQQAILIKLIIDIPADTASAHQLPVTQVKDTTDKPLPAQPSANQLIHNLWLTELFQRQIERNEASIVQIKQAIESTQQGFQSRTNEFRSETAQATLEMWHSHVIKNYQKYLVTLQTIQRTNRDRLSRLVSN